MIRAFIFVALVACERSTEAPPKTDTGSSAVVRDAAAIAPAIVDAVLDADVSIVPDEWTPSLRFRRVAWHVGTEHVEIAYGESAELAGITFRYAQRTWSKAAQRGSYTLVATKNGRSDSREMVLDAEVTVFDTAFMIDRSWDSIWIGLIENPQKGDCSGFGLAQIWQAVGLGGEWKGPDDRFYALPQDAQSFEMDGMFHVDYRGVRVSCGTLSGRVYAELRPRPTP